MARDGTNRGGRRVRAGAKPGPLGEKLAAGRPATRLEDPLNEPFDFAGNDIGDDAVRAGETMPEPSDYLSEIQRDGKPLGADLVYRETWQWLDQRGCSHFVAPRLIEAYAQAFARYVQCEQAISKFGLLGKHPTTGAAIASPFVAMSQSFGKQANVYWYEIYEIVRATCTTDYAGTTPGDEVMAAGRRIIVTGEITTNHRPRIRESVRTALARGVRIILQAGIRQWPQICVAMNLGVLLDGRYIHGLIGTARHGVGSLRPRTPVTSSANEFTGLQPVKNIFPFKASISHPRLAALRNPLLATNSIPVHLRGMKSPPFPKRSVQEEAGPSQRQSAPQACVEECEEPVGDEPS